MPNRILPDRAVIRLEGADTIALLERTVTHSVHNWAAGEMRYGALLTPQGKVIADYLATFTGTAMDLDVHADAADTLMKRLTMYRMRSTVEIQRLDDHVVTEGNAADVRSADLPGRAITPVADAGELLDREAWHTARIAAGIPEWGADYRDADIFPTDINMDVLQGVDYKKGCFIGQEVASRMKRKGGIRKRTLKIVGEGSMPGTDIVADDPVGTVTSAAGGAALALVRMDRLAKALQQGATFHNSGRPVRFDLTDWQQAEINAQQQLATDSNA